MGEQTGSEPKSRWYVYLLALIALSLLINVPLLLPLANYKAYRIPSSAMNHTLEIGDHILVDKWWYDDHPPVRGDVVVFTLAEDPSTTIIKRIVGLPGETVELRGTQLLIDGEARPEAYAQYLFGGKKDFGPAQIPPGKLLVFGDHRDQSKDSRYWPDPFLDISRLKGKALFIYWSRADFGRIGTKIR